MSGMFDLSPPKPEAAPLEVMKWMIAVMDIDDKSLMFTASVLAQAIKWNGLTPKQAEGISRVYGRVMDQFDRGILAIQGGGLAEEEGTPRNVTHITAHRRGNRP